MNKRDKEAIIQKGIESINWVCKINGVEFLALPEKTRFLLISAYQKGAIDILEKLR